MHITINENRALGRTCEHAGTLPFIALEVIQQFTGMDNRQTEIWAHNLGEDVHTCGERRYVTAGRIVQFMTAENQPAMPAHQDVFFLATKLAPYIQQHVPQCDLPTVRQSIINLIAVDCALNQPCSSQIDISAAMPQVFANLQQNEEHQPSRFNFGAATPAFSPLAPPANDSPDLSAAA